MSSCVAKVTDVYLGKSRWRQKQMTNDIDPDSKVHGANMGLTWGLSAPDGPHVPCYQGRVHKNMPLYQEVHLSHCILKMQSTFYRCKFGQIYPLLNSLFRLTTKEISKLRIYWALCGGEEGGGGIVTGGFSSQRASNADCVSISWRRYIFKMSNQIFRHFIS